MRVCKKHVCVVCFSVRVHLAVSAHNGYDWRTGKRGERMLKATCAINHSHLILLHQHQVEEIRIPLQGKICSRYGMKIKSTDDMHGPEVLSLTAIISNLLSLAILD